MCIITPARPWNRGEINWVDTGETGQRGGQRLAASTAMRTRSTLTTPTTPPSSLAGDARMEPLLDKVFASPSPAFYLLPEVNGFIDAQTYEALGLADLEDGE